MEGAFVAVCVTVAGAGKGGIGGAGGIEVFVVGALVVPGAGVGRSVAITMM